MTLYNLFQHRVSGRHLLLYDVMHILAKGPAQSRKFITAAGTMSSSGSC